MRMVNAEAVPSVLPFCSLRLLLLLFYRNGLGLLPAFVFLPVSPMSVQGFSLSLSTPHLTCPLLLLRNTLNWIFLRKDCSGTIITA